MEIQSQAFHVEAVPLLNEALSKGDNWTSLEDRIQRRRAQNRLNQRAARRRKNPQRATPLQSKLEDVRQGHQVGELQTSQQMRRQQQTRGYGSEIQEYRPSNGVHAKDTQHDGGHSHATHSIATHDDTHLLDSSYNPNCFFETRSNRNIITDFIARSRCTFPLSLDHLLPLIHTNIYRAVLTNLLLLRLSPYFLCSPTTTPTESILALPLPASIPPSLLPTQLQMSVPHPEWINVFPMPSARDALIRRWVEGTVDQCGFCFDLLGEEDKGGYGNKDIDDRDRQDDENADDYRQGLIIWGDPWVGENWEVTDGFLRKWGWIVSGCREGVLRSTNHWREIRGEEPLEWVEDFDS